MLGNSLGLMHSRGSDNRTGVWEKCGDVAAGDQPRTLMPTARASQGATELQYATGAAGAASAKHFLTTSARLKTVARFVASASSAALFLCRVSPLALQR